MNLELDFYNKTKEQKVLDINTLIGKSVEEITNIVKKSIIIDDYQGIIKIVLSGLPNDGTFLGQTETKNLKTLIGISVDTIINSIDYNNPENKLKN